MVDEGPPEEEPDGGGWRPPGWEEEPPAGQAGQPAGWEQQPSGPPNWGQSQPAGGPWPPPPGYGYARRTEGMAIAVLVLAILSWLLVWCGGTILAVIALAMIPSARRKLAASGGMLEGDGYLTAGKWLALINVALTALGIALLVFLAILGAIFDSTSTEGEFQMLLSALL